VYFFFYGYAAKQKIGLKKYRYTTVFMKAANTMELASVSTIVVPRLKFVVLYVL
jgi:hypothetical protein